MENTQTLGQIIGQVSDNFDISQYKGGPKTQMRMTWDFTTATDTDVKSWLCGNRRIAFQRPSRAMSVEELQDASGSVIMAVDAGKKVKTRSEQITTLMATGLTEGFAIMALDEPDKFLKAQALAEKLIAEQMALLDE